MNKASAIGRYTIADSTANGLLELVLKSGALVPGQCVDWLEAAWHDLLHKDEQLALWASFCPPPAAPEKHPLLPPDLGRKPRIPSHSLAPAENGRYPLTLCGWIPECVLGSGRHLQPPNPVLREQLIEASHLAVRVRGSSLATIEQWEQSKLSSLYHLAYGLSHELNNPLANISTRAGILLSRCKDKADREMLQTIVDNAMRGCEMLGDLMLIARPPELQFHYVDARSLLESFLNDAIPWAERWGLGLQAEINVQASLRVDATAIREALWCLLRNAIEASAAIADAIQIHCQVDDSRPWLRIQILDEGPGLSSESRQHCFDPYYSGREAGRGLGMGLTKARRLIDLHSGRLILENRDVGGCCALVELPLSDKNSHVADEKP